MYNDILDEITQRSTENDLIRLKKQQRTLATFFCAICLVSGIVSGLMKNNPSGAYQVAYVFGSVLGAFFFAAFPGFLLGSLFALIPYRGFTYRQKYTRSFLICGIVFAVIFSLATIGNASR